MADPVTDQSVPPQNATPPAVNNADATAVTNAASTPPPVAPSSNAPPPPVAGQDLSDQNAHHSMIGKVFSALAGGKPTGYAQTDKGPVPVKTDWAPGQLARHIVASAASMIAAGIGGQQAARNGRTFELQPGTSLGDIRNGDQEAAQKQAQQQWQNQREASEDVLRAQANAREQQRSIQEASTSVLQQQELTQKIASGNREALRDDYNFNTKLDEDFIRDVNTPGAKQIADTKTGKMLEFDNTPEGLRAAQAYVTAHPELLHGTYNQNDPASKYLVTIRRNPGTNKFNLIDLPPDMHDQKINYDGALRDKYGEVVFKNGAPVPDPNSPYRTKDGKPTVAAQPVSLAQKNDIDRSYQEKAKTHVTIDDIKAQAGDRERKDRKEDEGNIAWNLYDSGQLSKMNSNQRAIVAGTKRIALQASNERYAAAERSYEKAASNVIDDSEKEKLPEFKELSDAKNGYQDALEQYNNLTGNTQGVVLGDKLIRSGALNQPWPAIQEQIQNAGIPDEEKQTAIAKVRNAMSPAQRAAADATPTVAHPTGAKAPSMVTVVVDGKSGQIPANQIEAFKKKYPNAQVNTPGVATPATSAPDIEIQPPL